MFVATMPFAQSFPSSLAVAANYAAPPTSSLPPPAGPKDQRALLSLVVDDAPHGETLAVLRDKDILVSIDDLKNAGLRDFVGTRETVNGKSMVSLTSLAPAITQI